MARDYYLLLRSLRTTIVKGVTSITYTDLVVDDGEVYRDELDASYTGTAWDDTEPGDVAHDYDDNYQAVAPRNWPKTRTRVNFLAGSDVVSWAWADELFGFSIGPFKFIAGQPATYATDRFYLMLRNGYTTAALSALSYTDPDQNVYDLDTYRNQLPASYIGRGYDYGIGPTPDWVMAEDDVVQHVPPLPTLKTRTQHLVWAGAGGTGDILAMVWDEFLVGTSNTPFYNAV